VIRKCPFFENEDCRYTANARRIGELKHVLLMHKKVEMKYNCSIPFGEEN
jgi:hypothetical protein